MPRAFLFLFISLILSFVSSVCRADPDELQVIKQNIAGQVLENDRLRRENVELKRRYDDLQTRINQSAAQLRASSLQRQLRAAEWERQMASGRLDPAVLDELENEIMIRRTQVIRMHGALLDLEEQQRLWKLKAADEEYQRQELELELEFKKYAFEQGAAAYISKIDQLRREILRNRLEEKNLLAQHALLEDEAEILSRQKGIFENENVYLGKESREYRTLKEETEAQKNKAAAEPSEAQKQLDADLKEKQRLKEDLQKRLETLQKQRADLDKKLVSSLRRIAQRRNLIQEIRQLEDNNRELETLLSDLQLQAQSP